MQFLRKSLFSLFAVFSATLLMAQQPGQMNMSFEKPEISEEELSEFVEVMPEVNAIQMKFQQEMVSAVQENNMEVQRFNELARAQQNPNMTVEANETEMQSFNAAMQAVQAIQENLNQQVQGAVSESELTMSRFQEIAMAVNSDQELQQKVQQMMQDNEGGGQQ